MSRRVAAAVITATFLMGLVTSGCTDNNCQDEAICGDHNGRNALGSAPSASGDSAEPSETSTPTASAAPPAETTADSPDSRSVTQDASTDSGQSAADRPSRPQSVSLYTLCQSVDDGFDCGAYSPRSASVGDHTFSYVGETNPNDHGTDWKIVMGMSSTTCSSITLQFAAGDTQSNPNEEVRLRLTQERAAAVEATTKEGTIGKLSAKIVGGSSFKVEGSASYDTNVLVNGSAMCTTVSGK